MGNFVFESRLDNYLAATFALLSSSSKSVSAEIVKSAQPNLQTETSFDNWDGGQYAHTLTLSVSFKKYSEVVVQKQTLEQEIRDAINTVASDAGNESIETVCILPESAAGTDWRQQPNELPDSAEVTIWGKEGFRLFISHLAEKKELAAELKKQLGSFGVSCFVAHEDIEPTLQWQDQIETALMTMDGFVALMEKGFHDSKWTDQEIGYACARRVKIIPVSLGMIPYGFIGKYQALKTAPENLAWEIYKRLPIFKNEESAFISIVEHIKAWDDAVNVAKIFHLLHPMSEQTVLKILECAEQNPFVRDSTTFWKSTRHSLGFHHYIREWLGCEYAYDYKDCKYHKKQ